MPLAAAVRLFESEANALEGKLLPSLERLTAKVTLTYLKAWPLYSRVERKQRKSFCFDIYRLLYTMLLVGHCICMVEWTIRVLASQ